MAETAVNADLVRLLECALNDAKAGKLVAGAVIGVLGPGSAVAFSSMGRHPLEIVGAAHMLQDDVLIKMRQEMARGARIMRAGALPGLSNGAPLSRN
jgi:hypothetical protein